MKLTCEFKIFVLFIHLYFIQGLNFYSHNVKDNRGEDFHLEKYRGQVTLVVNVASHCGFTETTYQALTRLHDILSYGGKFSVLAFPCNQFGNQEPESSDVIAQNMIDKYGVEFPIFNKIDVIGEDASPAFTDLIEQSSLAPDWNFYKYLVGPNGEVISAWRTGTKIEDIFDVIQSAINDAKESSKQESNIDPKDEL